MTELDLYCLCIPYIAETIVSLRGKTPEQRIEWKRNYLEYAKSLGQFAYGFVCKTLAVIDSQLEEEEGAGIMRIDDIKIYPCFAAHEPRPEKMKEKERYFEEAGAFQSQIILDSRGNLIDGYTSYLLAKAHGIQHVPVRYGRRQIVKAAHKPGGKLYSWEVPGHLIGRVSAGDNVVVRAGRGVKVVTVAAVEDYAGDEPEPVRKVVRANTAVKHGSSGNRGITSVLTPTEVQNSSGVQAKEIHGYGK